MGVSPSLQEARRPCRRPPLASSVPVFAEPEPPSKREDLDLDASCRDVEAITAWYCE
jgi:hypothetical protein